MKTVLFSYEFGAGLGHLNRLVAVAKRLPSTCKPVFLVPDLVLAAPVLRRALGDIVEVIKGVNWTPLPIANIRDVPTATFADVIRLFGFNERSRLLRAVLQTEHLVGTLQPSAIVADFAPTLRLATFGQLPMTVVGNGYTVPPAGRVLPPMRSWDSDIPENSRAHEKELLQIVNDIQQERNRPVIYYFSELFHGESTFVCTIAEFDPYQPFRVERIIWPFNIPNISTGPKFPDRKGPAIFGYFQNDHPALGEFLQALRRMDVASAIYVQGANPNSLAAQCSRQTGIYVKPADFAQVLPQASLLVHHGGLGTAYSGLMAGVPQLAIPLNLEHMITSRGLINFGTGIARRVTSLVAPPNLAETMRSELSNKPRREVALRVSHALHKRRDPNPVSAVIDACIAQLS